MLSVNYIYNFLNKKQEKIDDSYYVNLKFFERNAKTDSNLINDGYIINDLEEFINSDKLITEYSSNKNEVPNTVPNENRKLYNNENKYMISLKDSFNIIFNKNIKDFCYDNKIYKNKSYIFTLLNSIFTASNEAFLLYDLNQKENIIKYFIRMIDNDLFMKDLYQKFDYVKDRSFNKADIQEVIKMAFQFKHNDKFNILKKYISDYLGINLYIISVENDLINYSKTEYYLPKHYGNEVNKFLPSIIIILENEIHKSIINKSVVNSNIIKYSDYNTIIDNLWIQLKIKKETKKEDIININNDIIKTDNIEIFKNDKCKDNNDLGDLNIIKNLEEDTQDKNLDDKDKNQDYKDKNLDDKDKNQDDINADDIKKTKYNAIFLSKQKINTIKELCLENNICLQKKSTITSTLINKFKYELINELLNL
jgi:hypothetical protein